LPGIISGSTEIIPGSFLKKSSSRREEALNRFNLPKKFEPPNVGCYNKGVFKSLLLKPSLRGRSAESHVRAGINRRHSGNREKPDRLADKAVALLKPFCAVAFSLKG
jgi:hypothetical protein